MAADMRAALPGARPLSRSTFGDMLWSRPGLFRRELRLEAGSELLARLRWEKPFSSDAVAESADGRWIIQRERSFGPGRPLCVREIASGAEVATFTPRWRGAGVIRFTSGTEFRLKREGFWRPRYFWTDRKETRLVTFHSVLGFRRSFEMTVDDAARRLAELPVLVTLGAYIMSRRARGSHAH
jgi:hypothetical protein